MPPKSSLDASDCTHDHLECVAERNQLAPKNKTYPIQMPSSLKSDDYHRKGRQTNKFCHKSKSVGKVLLGFVAGAWFAVVMQSKHLSNTFSSVSFRQILKGKRLADDTDMRHKKRTIEINNILMTRQRNGTLVGYRDRVNRKVQLYPAEYSDVTQNYPYIESSDIDSEDEEQMEMRIFPEHESKPDCKPIAAWQSTQFPACSKLHEIDISTTLLSSDISLLSSKGSWRDVWEVWDQSQSGWSKFVGGHENTVVLKTLKYEHAMQDAYFELQRVDAISMERLTSSPYVMNIYGFCGMSVITAFGEETVTKIADSISPLGKLFMARLIAKGLSDVHGMSLVHNDINYANLLVAGPRRLPQFSDFNLSVLQMHGKNDSICTFKHHFPNPQWRSYEEQVGPNGSTQDLTEKIDVYALGNIFYRFIAGQGPWKTASWRAQGNESGVGESIPGAALKITKEDKAHIARIKREEGALPPISDNAMVKIQNDSALHALYKAMKKCYKFDPEERPSAAELVQYLDLQLDKLDPDNKERSDPKQFYLY